MSDPSTTRIVAEANPRDDPVLTDMVRLRAQREDSEGTLANIPEKHGRAALDALAEYYGCEVLHP